MIKGNIIAHYQKQSETKIEKIQSLEEHLFNVAYRGRHAATVIGQDDLLFLIGLFHDVGKADRAFQDKLLKHPDKQVDHSYAGALYLWNRIQQTFKGSSLSKSERKAFKEIVCYVISAPHGVYDIPLPENTEDIQGFGFSKLRQRMMDKVGYHFTEDIQVYVCFLENQLSQFGYANIDDLIEKAFANYQLAIAQLNRSYFSP